MHSDFGFASGQTQQGGYSRIWFGEMLPSEEIAFDSDVYLLLPKTAEAFKAAKPAVLVLEPQGQTAVEPETETPTQPKRPDAEVVVSKSRTLRIYGEIPTEVWQSATKQ